MNLISHILSTGYCWLQGPPLPHPHLSCPGGHSSGKSRITTSSLHCSICSTDLELSPNLINHLHRVFDTQSRSHHIGQRQDQLRQIVHAVDATTPAPLCLASKHHHRRQQQPQAKEKGKTDIAMMDDFVSESESDYTSYWRDWVCCTLHCMTCGWRWCGVKLFRACLARCHHRCVSASFQQTLNHHNLPPFPPCYIPCPSLMTALASTKRVLDTVVMPEPPRKRARRLTGWIYEQFISSRGNEYFCEIDEEYLTDRFNLTGLNTEVQYYQYALDLITDVFDVDCDDEMRETIEKSARHLYGLVHARYIVTTRGLGKMVCCGLCEMRRDAID